MSQTLEKTYNPKEIEQHWYQTWEKNGYFKPDINHEKTQILSQDKPIL